MSSREEFAGGEGRAAIASPTLAEVLSVLPVPPRGRELLRLLVHSMFLDMGFVPLPRDSDASCGRLTPTSLPCNESTPAQSRTSACRLGSLTQLQDGSVARVVFAFENGEGEQEDEAWNCSYTRPEWRCVRKVSSGTACDGDFQVVVGQRVFCKLAFRKGTTTLAIAEGESSASPFLEICFADRVLGEISVSANRQTVSSQVDTASSLKVRMPRTFVPSATFEDAGSKTVCAFVCVLNVWHAMRSATEGCAAPVYFEVQRRFRRARGRHWFPTASAERRRNSAASRGAGSGRDSS